MKIKYNPELKELARTLRNSSTKAEIRLWRYLKGKQLLGYDFHRQKPIDNYIANFFSNTLMLAIELDGYTHGFEEIYEKDKKKERRLNEMGITVLRYRDEDVMNNIDGVIEDIKACINKIENKHTPAPLIFRGEVMQNKGEIKMIVTRKLLADMLTRYINREIDLGSLVSWAEDMLAESDFEDGSFELIRDILAHIGLSDVR